MSVGYFIYTSSLNTKSNRVAGLLFFLLTLAKIPLLPETIKFLEESQDMIVITGVIQLAQQSEFETVERILKNRAQRSRKDQGCIDYSFSINVEDPYEIRLIEIWESEELLNLHLQIPDPEFDQAISTAEIQRATVIAHTSHEQRTLLSR